MVVEPVCWWNPSTTGKCKNKNKKNSSRQKMCVPDVLTVLLLGKVCSSEGFLDGWGWKWVGGSPGCTYTAECWVDSLAARWATTIRWLPMRFCEEWPNLQGLPSFFGSVALIGPLIHYSSLFDCPSIRPIFDQLSKALKGSHLTYHWAKEEFNLNKLPVHCEARDFPIKRAF